MTRIILTCIAFLLLTNCTVTVKNGDTDKDKMEKTCDAIMQSIKDGNLAAGMELMKKNSIIADADVDSLHSKMIGQQEILNSYGKIVSFELVDKKDLSTYLERRYYVLRYEHYYYVYLFTIFNTANGWRITQFKYNDTMLDFLI